MGERSLKSASCSQGAPRNQKAVNRVKSAVYQKSRQSAMDRCETAALKRVVWPMVQLVSTPPPLPPVTPSLPGSPPAACDEFGAARHEVFEVVTRIGVLNEIAELLAVAGAAARIGIEIG